MRHLLAIALLAATLGTVAASAANAYSTCTRQCYGSAGYQTCTTNCY
jgi:hypothetical protein